jgi:hypothetical protein
MTYLVEDWDSVGDEKPQTTFMERRISSWNKTITFKRKSTMAFLNNYTIFPLFFKVLQKLIFSLRLFTEMFHIHMENIHGLYLRRRLEKYTIHFVKKYINSKQSYLLPLN